MFNAHECGLVHKLAPHTTAATKGLPDRKKMKDRITSVVCANADGSEKTEMMIISNAVRPRPFKKSRQEHGFDYHANKKVWMTTNLFFEWLNRFNS